MSNYPPGVTGYEYEIAGPDNEVEESRYCGSDDCVDEDGEPTLQEGISQEHGGEACWTCYTCEEQQDIELEWDEP